MAAEIFNINLQHRIFVAYEYMARRKNDCKNKQRNIKRKNCAFNEEQRWNHRKPQRFSNGAFFSEEYLAEQIQKQKNPTENQIKRSTAFKPKTKRQRRKRRIASFSFFTSQRAMMSVPAAIRTQPISDFGVNLS